MKFSSREAMLLLITAAVALFGGSAMLARPKIEEWKELREQQAQVIEQIERDKRLVGKRDDWARQFEELKKMLPQYPADKKMDVHWRSVMDRLASKHGVKIIKLDKAQKEHKQADVYELPIECKEWEGSLDSMVHFLFDLQTEGAMLTIRQLLVKPKGKGLLRGRFSLYCAYTREQKPPARPAGEGAGGQPGDRRGVWSAR